MQFKSLWWKFYNMPKLRWNTDTYKTFRRRLNENVLQESVSRSESCVTFLGNSWCPDRCKEYFKSSFFWYQNWLSIFDYYCDVGSLRVSSTFSFNKLFKKGKKHLKTFETILVDCFNYIQKPKVFKLNHRCLDFPEYVPQRLIYIDILILFYREIS